MLSKRKIEQLAKVMYKNSFTSVYLDNTKIVKILKTITSSNIRETSKILKNYKRLIEAQASREEIFIESPEKLNLNTEKQIIAKTGAKKIQYQINPNLVFGAIIKHGDWVWDDTLDSKLGQILRRLEV